MYGRDSVDRNVWAHRQECMGSSPGVYGSWLWGLWIGWCGSTVLDYDVMNMNHEFLSIGEIALDGCGRVEAILMVIHSTSRTDSMHSCCVPEDMYTLCVPVSAFSIIIVVNP
jgi:hypothetical protein